MYIAMTPSNGRVCITLILAGVLGAACFAGCDGGGNDLSLAEELGLTQYSGLITPLEHSSEGNETTYTFDAAEGPVCMRGAPYRMAVRDQADSNDLVVFLQGGGACWSDFCLAVTGAPVGIPRVEILNPDLDYNPVADWDVVYLPYCDGSFFGGDSYYDDDLNGNGARTHRGLANLTAALEVASMHFPTPDRILLAGSSGGAYGLLLGAPMTRHYFPFTELIIMADSGIGLARDGEPEYIQKVLDEFNMTRFLPEDCDYCQVGGHVAGLMRYFLENDDNSRAGMFMSWHDGVLGGTFLQVPDAQHAAAIQNGTDPIHEALPDRFRRFIVDGVQHTSLLADPTGIIGSDLEAVELPPGALSSLMSGELLIGDMQSTKIGELDMATWLGALIDNDLETWVDVLETPSPRAD